MSIKKEFPILEYDYSRQAVIEPHKLFGRINIPEKCVITFFKDVIDRLKEENRLAIVTELRSEAGIHPIYEMVYGAEKLIVYHSMVGAPSAVGLLEEVTALGCRKFIACGGAGVIQREIAVGHLIIPTAAIRDEGTSYHYLPPSREVEINIDALKSILKVLDRHKIPYIQAKTWTTDAFYRETKDKVELRRQEGCVSVEMECSALAAVAEFRNLTFGQILYGGDDVSCEEWDSRCWHERTDVREKVFVLAVESCLNL